jgi:hypothetical protein
MIDYQEYHDTEESIGKHTAYPPSQLSSSISLSRWELGIKVGERGKQGGREGGGGGKGKGKRKRKRKRKKEKEKEEKEKEIPGACRGF